MKRRSFLKSAAVFVGGGGCFSGNAGAGCSKTNGCPRCRFKNGRGANQGLLRR